MLDFFLLLTLSAIGYLAGRWLAKFGYWGLFGAIVLLTAVAIGRLVPRFEFIWPFTVLVTGRREIFILAFAASLFIAGIVAQVTNRRLRVLLVGLLGVAVAQLGSNFLWSIFNRETLLKLPTTLDRDGVCLQQNDYTCVPAAAVTILRRLGLNGELGELAVAAQTTATGTMADEMADALKHRYGAEGLICRYRYFTSLDDLDSEGNLTLVGIRFGWFEDHCLAVLAVEKDEILVADPLLGLRRMPREEFAAVWRQTGVEMRRERGDNRKRREN